MIPSADSSTDPPVAAFRWALAVKWRVMNDRSEGNFSEEEEKKEKKNEASAEGERKNGGNLSLCRGEGGLKKIQTEEGEGEKRRVYHEYLLL